MRLIVLRPPRKWEETREICGRKGVEPVLVPLLHVAEGESTELSGFLEAVLDHRADWVVFTGATGVQAVLDHAAARGRDRSLVTALDRGNVAAIGARTEQALAAAGIRGAVVPDRTDSHGLVEALTEAGVEGAHVEIPRSDRGSGVLREGLEQAGAETIHEFAAYTLTTAEEEDVLGDAVTMLRAGEIDGVLFTSALTAETFFELGADLDVTAADLKDVVVGAMGEPTAKALRAMGVEPDAIPRQARLEDLIDAVKEKAGRGPS